jgi:DNA-binding NtrC family response regulator
MARTFLILCDDALFRAALKATLVRAGFEATGADSFQSAWKHFQARKFDLLFCDLGKDEPARLSLLQKPEARWCWGQLLLSTNGLGCESALEAIRQAGGEVLVKPLRHGDVIEAASRLLLRHIDAAVPP